MNVDNKTILILTAKFGAGHTSAAKAIKEAILCIDNNYNVIIQDFIDASLPILNKPMIKMYETHTKYAPVFYNYYYYLRKSFDPKLDISNKIYTPRLIKYILKVNPTLIISTFPLASACIYNFKTKYPKMNIPTITVVTDVVDSLEWVFPSTDIYFVPSIEIKNRFMQRGIHPNKIKVVGVPVSKSFHNLQKEISNKYRILLLGGGRGLFDFSIDFLYWLDDFINEDMEVCIVTGKNRNLYDALTKKKPVKNIKVLGFVDDMPNLIKKYDLLITKPGGATLFEAIHTTTPVIVKSPYIGQEIENARFVIDKGLGIIYNDENDLKNILKSIINKKLDSIIEFMKNNMLEFKKTIDYKNLSSYILDKV